MTADAIRAAERRSVNDRSAPLPHRMAMTRGIQYLDAFYFTNDSAEWH